MGRKRGLICEYLRRITEEVEGGSGVDLSRGGTS